MFHRRTRSASASRPQNTNASAPAHMAAAQAFLANRQSQGNLSASAAAAALRSMSPSSTAVDQVQTKRMVQRQNSQSPRGRSRGGLQRRDSSGSMTERTFRSPSPGRPAASADTVQAPPPVPKLPEQHVKPPPIPAKSKRRSASMEAPPPRVLSPPLTRPAGRGQSMDRRTEPVPPQQVAAQRSAKMPKIPELERNDSRNSINFSRPLSPSVRSPATPSSQGQPPANVGNGITAAEAASIQYELNRAAQQPIKKKKKKLVREAAEGSHLQSGSMGSRPVTAPAVESTSETTEPQAIRKKKKVAVTGQSTHFPPSPASTQTESESDSTPEKTKDRRAQRASGVLAKQPSTVKEDWEGEQQGERYPSTSVQTIAEEGSSPVRSPATPIPGKRPTTAANVSKKIDETPASPKPASQPDVQPATQTTHNAVTMASTTSEPVSAVQHLAVAAEAQHSRGASLSPSRSTRFSDRLSSDLAAGRKHEPMQRSISPAKSALKHHSPSPQQGASPTDPHFPRARGSSVTPSESSDITDMSTDGVPKKKKSAHVSFEPDPEVVGTVVESSTIDSPAHASSQNKDTAKKGWFGFGKAKQSNLGTIAAEDEMEEVMKPRPELPSFGSVRGQGRRNEAASESRTSARPTVSSHQAVISSATSSEASSSSNIPTLNTSSVSSDHAIGNILSQDAHRRSQATPTSTMPPPPEVTSVEGTGYASDSDTEQPQHKDRVSRAPEVAESAQASSAAVTAIEPVHQVDAPATSTKAAVPTLSVQPPTPGLEQDRENPVDQWLVAVPGGFPASSENLANPEDLSGNLKEVPAEGRQRTPSAGLGLTNAASIDDTSMVKSNETEPSLRNREVVERDSDHDSIYSDAEEDLSYMEGDGFGSINAIVESPTVTTPSKRITTPPDSPLARTASGRPTENARTASWDETQAHWSGIAQLTRQSPPPQATDTRSEVVTPPSQQTRQKKNSPAAASTSSPIVPVTPLDSPATIPTQAPAYPPVSTRKSSKAGTGLRQSMRDQEAPTEPAMRQSMREQRAPGRTAQPGAAKRKTMRGPPAPAPAPAPAPVAALSSQQRPVSPGQPRAALQKKYIPPAVVSKPASRVPPVQRTMSNDSDSESSFRKARKNKGAANGQYSMRRSMRAAGPSGPEPPASPAGRGGVRSLSPVARRPFSPAGGQKSMRSSMRGPADAATPTLRNPVEKKRSSSLFGRSTKVQNPPSAAPMPLTKAVRSRFVDSDGEDEPGPTSFRSRFDDSSDEEPEPVTYRPVRGIPRKIDEGDSTDLEDSSDDEKKAVKMGPQRPPQIDTAVPAAAASTPSSQSAMSPATAKKRGLFGRFSSKKVKEEGDKSKLGVGTIADRNAILTRTAPAVEAARDPEKISTPDKEKGERKKSSQLGFSSTAERDAVIEQTRAKLEAAKSTQRPGSSPAGKLQRRHTPQRIMSDSWPLPPKMPAEDDGRPNTADGLSGQKNGSALRPGLDREPTTDTLGSSGVSGFSSKTGKKKRFPMLRKAFGLKD